MARGYFRHLLIAVDQFANTLHGGWPDETLSSHAGRHAERQPWKTIAAIIDAVFRPFQGANHCQNAIQKEKSRYHFHKDMR
jgi:hypothetical protein